MGNLAALGRRWWPQAVAVVAVLAVGFILGDQSGDAEPVNSSPERIRMLLNGSGST
jgi:hypothetical protein